MSVTFVYRSHYSGPSEKHVVAFNEPSVLAWFRARWTRLATGSARDAAKEILGANVYGFATLGEAIAEHDIAAPETMQELSQILDEHLYVEGEIVVDEHCIQILTDDDELQLAYYFFDDAFEAEHPGRAAFLSRPDWKLPTESEPGESFVPRLEPTELNQSGDRGAGCVWLARLAYYDSGNLYDLEGAHALTGIRLPELAAHLAAATAPKSWPFELRLLRSQLLATDVSREPIERDFVAAIRSAPDDAATWAVYGDWLLDKGRAGAGRTVLERALTGAALFPVAQITNGISTAERLLGDLDSCRQDASALLEQADGRDLERCHLAVSDHLAQLCLFTDDWGQGPMYHQWILFDDHWASANRELADGVLTFATRWDVLSDGEPQD